MKKINILPLLVGILTLTGCASVQETFNYGEFHTQDFHQNYYSYTPEKYLNSSNYEEIIVDMNGKVSFSKPTDNSFNTIILSDLANRNISLEQVVQLYGDDVVKALKRSDFPNEPAYIIAVNEALARNANLNAAWMRYAQQNSLSTGNYGKNVNNAFKKGVFSKLTDTLIVCDGTGSLVRIQINEAGIGQTFEHELIDYRNFVISARGGTSLPYGQPGFPPQYIRSANVTMKISFYIEKSTTSRALKYTLIYDVPEMSSDNNSITTVMTMDLAANLEKDALKRVSGMTIEYELNKHDYFKPAGVPFDDPDHDFALMLYEVMFPYSTWR